MIVTLAGHVDHGKTTLVQLLTGIDTDRLQEEQRRGLTIDLGFAYLHEGTTHLGFVDVPGHHRFIHNMVAGIAAMQQALLVIAADDGPMPQSREHLQILSLLGVRDGVVALTKCDRVDAARRTAARSEIRELLAGSFLADAPIIETTGVADAGLDALRAELLGRARTFTADATPGSFRLGIDRVFTLRGAGLVVTGTVHAGTVATDDEVHAFPGGGRLRVRGLHVQDRPADVARRGDRAALNLAGDGSALERGHWLTARPEPGHHSAVLRLQVLADFPRTLRHWSPVHVYHTTSHAQGRLALLEGPRAMPGSEVLAEVVLDTPLAVKHGDALILRDQDRERTLGGGRVVDNRPAPGRRRAPERLASIAACEHHDPALALDAWLALGPVATSEFQSVFDIDPATLDGLLAERPLVRLDDRIMTRALWETWSADLAAECSQRHAADPTLPGLRENEFVAVVPAALRQRLLTDLVSNGRLEQAAGRYRPPRLAMRLDPAERSLLDRLRPLLDQAQPPSVGDLARTLKVPMPQLQQRAKALAGKGELVVVNDKRLYLPPGIDELAAVAERLSAEGPFTARDYRDAAGIGRNVAIDVLEFFDARGFTRRQSDTRTVVGTRSQLSPALG